MTLRQTPSEQSGDPVTGVEKWEVLQSYAHPEKLYQFLYI